MKSRVKKSTKTLSDKIADALTVKPRADIEDDQVFGTKPKTVSRVDFNSSESEDETSISDFRKRNVNLLSEISKKYEGQVVSRKKNEENDSDASEASDDDVSSEGNSDGRILHLKSKNNGLNNTTNNYELSSSDEDNNISSQSKPEDNSDLEDVLDGDEESNDYSITRLQKHTSDSEERSDEDAEDEGYDISQMEEHIQEEFEHVKKQNISEEAKKGACVRSQLLLWEGLLEMRIHLQRCVNTANQMPLPETHEELKGHTEFAIESNATKANVANALDKLLTLQNILLKSFPETKTISNSKNSQKKEQTETKPIESDEEIPSDTEDEEIPSDTDIEDDVKVTNPSKLANPINNKKRKLDEYEKDIATSHKAFKTFRDSTIQKWNDKTRLATAANIKNAPSNTMLQQISYILSDKNKLIKRTQLKRTEYDIIGYEKQSTTTEKNQNETINPITRDRKNDDEYIPEIFDDNDFYHQLLRELIECKSADISDPVQLSRQWIALQQMRSKMKRKVDTKATKGRKIKYVVHNQLVNYMAPEKCTKWTDEAINELYTSLFGKLFEQNNVGFNGNLVSGLKIKE